MSKIRNDWLPLGRIHILVRVLQQKHPGRFDSNFAHTFFGLLPTWWAPIRMFLQGLQFCLVINSSRFDFRDNFCWNWPSGLGWQTEYWYFTLLALLAWWGVAEGMFVENLNQIQHRQPPRRQVQHRLQPHILHVSGYHFKLRYISSFIVSSFPYYW